MRGGHHEREPHLAAVTPVQDAVDARLQQAAMDPWCARAGEHGLDREDRPARAIAGIGDAISEARDQSHETRSERVPGHTVQVKRTVSRAEPRDRRLAAVHARPGVALEAADDGVIGCAAIGTPNPLARDR
jgi:hypothetical protein